MKKNIILTLTFALTFMGAKAQQVISGDTNNDGVITMADVTYTIDLLLGKTTAKTVNSQEFFIRENKLTGSYIVNGATKTFASGYEYVDLDLPSKTLWCATNLEGYTPGQKTEMTCAEAAALVPSGWSIPTVDQLLELKNNCNLTEVNIDGIDMLKISSKQDANKYILVSMSVEWLGSSSIEGNAVYWAMSVSTKPTFTRGRIAVPCVFRPVISPSSIPSSPDSENGEYEVGSGEGNGELE